MPMYLVGRDPDGIARPDRIRFFALHADPALSREHLKDLALTVGVPIGPCARREKNVVDGHCVQWLMAWAQRPKDSMANGDDGWWA